MWLNVKTDVCQDYFPCLTQLKAADLNAFETLTVIMTWFVTTEFRDVLKNQIHASLHGWSHVDPADLGQLAWWILTITQFAGWNTTICFKLHEFFAPLSIKSKTALELVIPISALHHSSTLGENPIPTPFKRGLDHAFLLPAVWNLITCFKLHDFLHILDALHLVFDCWIMNLKPRQK